MDATACGSYPNSGWVTDNFQAPAGSICRKTNTNAGCGSIFLNPGITYSRVSGFATIYSYGSPDAGVEAVTMWSGSNIIWQWVVAYGSGSVGGPTTAGCSGECCAINFDNTKYWCAGAIPPGQNWGTYLEPSNANPLALFGALKPIGGPQGFVSVPASSSPIEIRICTDQDRADEDIYVAAAQVTVS